LDQVLGRLPKVKNENVLVGFDTSDDAGVYQLSAELALVQTVDFFTPIVDDPYLFGQIAAANSLSDVYAMGGRPLSALTIVAFPGNGDPEVLSQIMGGGFDKMLEAGCAILGGHSIADEEIKFGYAVTGSIHPDRILANAGARVGDALVLTKRLGTGVITTALKRGIARPEHVEAAVESMRTLNGPACQIMLRYPVHGCTDITGFGLLGHARELAKGSGVTAVIDHRQLEFLPGALDYAAQGAIPGGLKNNREFVSCAVEAEGEIPAAVESLLYDPQTSGGLLISVEAGRAEELTQELRGAGVPANIIGEVFARGERPIRLEPLRSFR
jgi:selenide,water dikinase